jgi:hypothetical protein
MLGKVVDSVVGVAGGKLQFIYLIFIKTLKRDIATRKDNK